MPIAEIQLPDGRIAEFEVEEGTTEEQILAFANQQFSAPEPQPEAIDPAASMAAIDRFNAGMGAGVTDLALGTKQALTEYGNTRTLGQMLSPQQQMTLLARGDDLSRKLIPDSAVADVQSEVDAKRRLDAPLNSGWGKAGKFTGNVLPAILANMLPGANTYAGSALIGSGMGLAQPTAEGESRGLNTLIGGGAGAAGFGLASLPGKIANSASGKIASIEAAVAEKAALQAAAETASARSAAGNAAQNAYRQLEHLRDLGAKGALTPEQALVVSQLEKELAEKAAEKLLPAAAAKESTAKAYQEAMETEADRAAKMAAEKLSGKEAKAQFMARFKRYAPAAAGGILGDMLFPGLGGQVGGAAAGLVLRPAIRSMFNYAKNPAVQRGYLSPATKLDLLSNPIFQTGSSTALPAGLLDY